MLLKNGYVLQYGCLVKKDVLIADEHIANIDDNISIFDMTIDVSGCWIIPGTIDVHTHFREPGFESKGTIKMESASAAKGGVVRAMAMPNIDPVPDCRKNLELELLRIYEQSDIEIFPYGAVTKGENGVELAELNSLKGEVYGLSDDGKGFNNTSLLEKAMEWAAANNVVIASHAEYENLGTSPAAEYMAVERELEMVKRIGCKYHFCHMSTKESFDMIKAAQLSGVGVTCEVTPHHLFLSEDDINGNTNYKMNPPLRSERDRLATVEALLSGVASMVATDHAPHSEQDKAVPYEKAPNGIIGLETVLPVVYTLLVQSGKASYDDFLNWVVYNPAKRFGLPCNTINAGERADIAVIDLSNCREYTKSEIRSKGKNSPFIGRSFYGFNRLTILDGKVLYRDI